MELEDLLKHYAVGHKTTAPVEEAQEAEKMECQEPVQVDIPSEPGMSFVGDNLPDSVDDWPSDWRTKLESSAKEMVASGEVGDDFALEFAEDQIRGEYLSVHEERRKKSMYLV
jgi:hypothetical protein